MNYEEIIKGLKKEQEKNLVEPLSPCLVGIRTHDVPAGFQGPARVFVSSEVVPAAFQGHFGEPHN